MGNDDPTCSPVKSKNSETLLNKPNEAENSLKPNSTSLTSDPTFSTPKTPLLSTRNENWRPNSNKPRVKSTNLNRLLLKVVENKSRNSKPECENSRTNLTPNRNELPNPSNPTERWRGKSRKFLTNPKRTRRT